MLSIHSWLDNFPDLVQAAWQTPQLTGHHGMVPGTGYKQESWNSNGVWRQKRKAKLWRDTWRRAGRRHCTQSTSAQGTVTPDSTPGSSPSTGHLLCCSSCGCSGDGGGGGSSSSRGSSSPSQGKQVCLPGFAMALVRHLLPDTWQACKAASLGEAGAKESWEGSRKGKGCVKEKELRRPGCMAQYTGPSSPLHGWLCASQRQSMDLCRQVVASTDSILPTILLGSSWVLHP